MLAAPEDARTPITPWPAPQTHYRVAAAAGFLLPCAVPKLRSLVRYWLPLLVWMSVIFSASSDRMSFEHSSRIIGPFVHWLFPHLSDQAIHACVMFARKCAHLSEYAVLALLIWRALRKPPEPNASSWRWPDAGMALSLAALYAASDEIHQTFVPSRQGSVWDVLVDTAGAAFGLLCLWLIGRWRKRW
jgi:VanZ family protein